MDSPGASVATRARTRRSREGGQALVEFALILPFFMLIVVGMIQFGLALNYWLDLNRIANQGARWAVVDHGWTNCPVTAPKSPCTSPTLQDYLETQQLSSGNQPQAYICFPNGATANSPGNPVEVRVRSEFQFAAIANQFSITLRGKATMRIEQQASRYLPDGPC